MFNDNFHENYYRLHFVTTPIYTCTFTLSRPHVYTNAMFPCVCVPPKNRWNHYLWSYEQRQRAHTHTHTNVFVSFSDRDRERALGTHTESHDSNRKPGSTNETTLWGIRTLIKHNYDFTWPWLVPQQPAQHNQQHRLARETMDNDKNCEVNNFFVSNPDRGPPRLLK